MFKFINYEVSGIDKNGPFLIFRRFNDFINLRLIMTKKWPGVMIPILPEKKSTV